MKNFSFKKWLNEKTLYHGTIIDNEPSIKTHGLVGGWHGPLGNFVSHVYGDEEYGEPSEEDEIVFSTDKQNLGKAITAMVHHISQKLNKNFHDVTDNDIRNHGLLIIIKNIDDKEEYNKPFNPNDKKWAYKDPPRGVEPGDYYSGEYDADLILKGSALIRFLKRNKEWPRDWPFIKPSKDTHDTLKGRLASWAIRRGLDKENVLKTLSEPSTTTDKIRDQLKQWENTN